MSRLAFVTTPRFFRFWVGYGGIVYMGLALAFAGAEGPDWLLLTLALGALWWWETSTGYCRRCTHFNCGPHGAVMRRLFTRDARPLPPLRFALHAAFDLLMFVWPQRWFWRWPWLGAATILWFALAAIAVLPFSAPAKRDAAKFGALLPPSSAA